MSPGELTASFTQSEIVGILGRTSLDPEARAEVMGALQRYVGERALEQREAEFVGGIVQLATIYERVEGEGVSGSNIEGWYERLEAQSEDVLRSFAGRQELGPTESVARNLAALLYIGLRRQANSRLDVNLLQDTGLGEETLIEQCRVALVEAAADQGTDTTDLEERVRARYPTLHSIPGEVVQLFWGRLIAPTATELRASLVAAGYELPKLNEHGEYPDEDDLAP